MTFTPTPFERLSLIKRFKASIKRRSFLSKIIAEEYGCNVSELRTVNAYCHWVQKMEATSEIRVTRDGQLRVKSSLHGLKD